MATLVLTRPEPALSALPVCEAAERGRDWMAELYHETCNSVYRYALMFVRDPHLAEDIAAEAYLRAWRARDRFESNGTPIAWLLSITRNCALDELRKRREQVHLDAVADFEESSNELGSMLSENDVNAIHDAIRRLTSEQQQVIFLRFFEELPHEQVAQRLGRNPNAIRAIQFRALSRMRKLLEERRVG